MTAAPLPPSVPFVRMHGLGNTFVILDDVAEGGAVRPVITAAWVREICDARGGVGADGVLILSPPRDASSSDLDVTVMNADGSDGGMCGNGLRCVARLAHDRGYMPTDPASLRLRIGGRIVCATIKQCSAADADSPMIAIDMGTPDFEPEACHVDASVLTPGAPDADDAFEVTANGQALTVTFVSLGNPHAVWFVDDVSDVELAAIGPAVEHHAAFTQRMNLQVAQTIDRNTIRLRTWERGCGITPACGSGACAAAAAAIAQGACDHCVTVRLDGGQLEINWPARDAAITMTGHAAYMDTGIRPLRPG